MRIVALGDGGFDIEAELDGPIAVGFGQWAGADDFLVHIQELQREPFL